MPGRIQPIAFWGAWLATGQAHLGAQLSFQWVSALKVLDMVLSKIRDLEGEGQPLCGH